VVLPQAKNYRDAITLPGDHRGVSAYDAAVFSTFSQGFVEETTILVSV
jgi:hypothetical protein